MNLLALMAVAADASHIPRYSTVGPGCSAAAATKTVKVTIALPHKREKRITMSSQQKLLVSGIFVTSSLFVEITRINNQTQFDHPHAHRGRIHPG